MDMTELWNIVGQFVPLLATTAAVVGILAAINRYLRRRWHDNPDAQFRFQLIMLALSFAGLLAILVALPINDALRGQLLSLIGILLSAAIALSSTTFIGNIMAGIMLKVMKNVRPGDFITVAELTGRITEMDLLHTEIQTEFRDLVTVPNIYMVTRPLQVVRSSGTIIQAEVSLGYDVSHSRATDVLCVAASNAGLKDNFAQVRELGDFAVTYRVAGLLEDVTSLISARSKLRAAMLDALHNDGIEVVSPNFMNTRALSENGKVMPSRTRRSTSSARPSAEDLAFDKADEAASIEKIRTAIQQTEAAI
ncbi:MAG: mechanosensitive ion channel family protein, partial [Pseudomonadota bacterium]